jgi:hypothetical protein
LFHPEIITVTGKSFQRKEHKFEYANHYSVYNQCWFTDKIWIEKTYEGGGKYGSAVAEMPNFDRIMVKIACENVK